MNTKTKHDEIDFFECENNEIIKADEMKNEYRNTADIKIKKIVTLINVIVNDK